MVADEAHKYTAVIGVSDQKWVQFSRLKFHLIAYHLFE